eukprot:gnl/Dysnectes_brevis/2740_a3333_1757.p1 GENE.gnl/Dysnectes_brevis/2740_a3333_1757~~gnl/Dysnectes_brevis/2740_a3333_1757.p1  ORF type:complete len:197 (+),score=27.67 gnl/Dysnectes_brevis/2740_a3333_1757:318-908(+)
MNVLLLLLIVLLSQIYSLEFELASNEQLCFLEELPEGVRLAGEYGALGDVYNMPIDIKVASPTGILYRQKDIPAKGTFAFHVPVGGEYRICFSNRDLLSARRRGTQSRRLFMELAFGTEGQTGRQDIISLLEGVEETVSEIRKDFQYMKTREDSMRSTSSQINSQVVWFGIFSTLVVSIGAYVTARWIKKFASRSY